jgi:copper chaperone CopZ
MSSTCKAAFLVFFLLVASRGSAQVQLAHDVAPAANAVSPGSTESAATVPVETKLKIAKTDTVIHVGDLHCKTCAKKISRRLYTVKGVMKVRTDIEADVAIVSPQPKKSLDVKALWVAAQKSGFPPVKLIGPAGTFEPDPETKGPKEVAEQVASRPE